jgi:glutaredoxin
MSKAAGELVMYATIWCADCARARRFLKARRVAWREVDVDADAAADERVLGHNAGARLLPMFEFGRRRFTLAPFDRAKLVEWLVKAGVAPRDQLSGAAPSGPAPRSR